MTEKTAGDVEVTREHRATVAAAFPTAQPGMFNMWVRDGSSAGIPGNFERLAQAIANAEARGRESSSAQVASLKAEVERLRRSAMGVAAPCRQCGDALAKCLVSMCCVGCNHSTVDPAFQSHTPELMMRFYDHVFNPDGSRKAAVEPQANEAPAPTVATADRAGLDADVETLRAALDSGADRFDVCPASASLDRIAAALGVKEQT